MTHRVGQGGFSLIEAMVALLIIAVGLLGVAGLQALSVNTTSNSRTRSLAALVASNMASYMGANASYWGVQTINTITVTPSGGVSPAPVSPIPDCTQTTCTPVQMAAYDLQAWAGSDQLGMLPGATGAVGCTLAPNTSYTGATCTVTVGWTEKSMSSNGGAGIAPVLTYYRLVTRP